MRGRPACLLAPSADHGATAPVRWTTRSVDYGQVMSKIVLRVRLIGGDRMDISYGGPETASEDGTIDHIVATLSRDSGVLRGEHGDRLVVLYGRGVAALEVAPRGAVL